MRKILNKMKTTALVMAMAISVTGCAADGKTETDGNNDSKIEQTDKPTDKATDKIAPESLVVTIGDSPVNYNEASYYLLFMKQQLESMYGSDQIWGIEVQEGVTFEDQLKEAVIEQLSRVRVATAEAEKAKIELTEEEKTTAKTSADQTIAAISQEDKDKYGLTDEIILKIMEDNVLCQKYMDEVTKDVDSNVPDEDVRQVTIQHLLLKTTVEKDGKTEDMSEAEQKKVLKKAQKLLAQAKKEKDFKAFAEKNTEDSNVEYTFGKGEMVAEFEEKAFSMKEGEFSEPVKTQYGYHILYCVNPDNKEAAETKKAQVIQERKMTAFEDKYAELKKNYEVKINNTIWDQVTVIAPVPSVSPEASTTAPAASGEPEASTTPVTSSEPEASLAPESSSTPAGSTAPTMTPAAQ